MIPMVAVSSYRLPIADANDQNTRMNEDKKSQKDIQRHLDEWIAKNADKGNSWLEGRPARQSKDKHIIRVSSY